MNIIVCLDDNFGMAFNGRRQSKDRYVRREILSLCGNARLWMNKYSFLQFEENTGNIVADDRFLTKAGAGEFCFIETDVISYDRVSRVYAFFWNTIYPSNLKFDTKGLTEISSRDFVGYSHKKITLKVYEQRSSV